MKKKLITTFLFISILVIGFSVSFYKSSKQVSASQNIAKPIIEIEGAQNFEITTTEEQTLGSDKTFSINNYKGEEINQTEMKYYIEFSASNINIDDLGITLVRNGSNVSLTKGVSPEFDLKIGEKQQDNFSVKIKYNGSSSVENGKISIKLHATQVQPK